MCALPCSARGGYAGIYNSLKGFGAVVEIEASPKSFNEFGLYADIYGFPSGRATFYPGGHAFWLHNRILGTFPVSDAQCSFYMGAGVAAGYGHDYESLRNSEHTYLVNPMGLSAAIAVDIGLMFEFARGMALDFSLEAEGGMFIGKDPQGSMNLGLYRNGLYNAYYPQISILWRF